MYETISELLAEIAAGEDAYLEFKEVVFKGNSPRFTGEKAKAPEAIARVNLFLCQCRGWCPDLWDQRSPRGDWRRPGGLHNTLRPENLFAGAQPYRRNQALAGFLRDYESPLTSRALMESRGEDFLMLVRETRALGGDVELISQPGALKLILSCAITRTPQCSLPAQ